MGFCKWLRDNWCRLLAVFFTDVLPVLSFGGVVSFRRVQTLFSLSVFGYGAIIVLCLLLLRRGKHRVEALPHGLYRGVLLSFFPALLWAMGFGIFLFGAQMAHKLLRWWILVGVCFFLGRLFAILDEIKRS